ncbi:hypothetical protein [Algicola sagamiensis]|uniref:hypothetical protein n=1 Tax=Algicola sagamiensis TaxID=163869 RepID=UPI0012FBCCA7|nr:hypothetical protein [Algicola sagamiensis]
MKMIDIVCLAIALVTYLVSCLNESFTVAAVGVAMMAACFVPSPKIIESFRSGLVIGDLISFTIAVIFISAGFWYGQFHFISVGLMALTASSHPASKLKR